MRNDIEKMKARLIECVERAQVFLEKYDIERAFKERRRAQKIYAAMIKRGKEGIDACLEIAESDHYEAAVLCCALTYDLHPRKSIKELKRINNSAKSVTGSIAGSMINMLKMGLRFDETDVKNCKKDFIRQFKLKDGRPS